TAACGRGMGCVICFGLYRCGLHSISAGTLRASPEWELCCGAGRLENDGVIERPPAGVHLADDGATRHGTPVAAVGAAIAMVAHHEVVVGGDAVWAPVLMAAEDRLDVAIVERLVVDEDAATFDGDDIAFLRDDALDENLAGIDRRVEHDDVAGRRF